MAGLPYDQSWLLGADAGEIKLLVPGGAVSGPARISISEPVASADYTLDFDIEIENPLLSMVLPVAGESQTGAGVFFHALSDGALLKVRNTAAEGVSEIVVERVADDFTSRNEVSRHQLFDGAIAHPAGVSLSVAFGEEDQLAAIWIGSSTERRRYYCYLSVFDGTQWSDRLLAEVEWEADQITQRNSISCGRILALTGGGYLCSYHINRPLGTSELFVGYLSSAGAWSQLVLADSDTSPDLTVTNVAFTQTAAAGAAYLLHNGTMLGQGKGLTLFSVDTEAGLAATWRGFLAMEQPPGVVPISPDRIWLASAEGLVTIPISDAGFGAPREDVLPASALSMGFSVASSFPYVAHLLKSTGHVDTLLLEGSYSVKDELGETLPSQSNLSITPSQFNRVYYLAKVSDAGTQFSFLGSGLGNVTNVVGGADSAYMLTLITPSSLLAAYTSNLGIIAKLATD